MTNTTLTFQVLKGWKRIEGFTPPEGQALYVTRKGSRMTPKELLEANLEPSRFGWEPSGLKGTYTGNVLDVLAVHEMWVEACVEHGVADRDLAAGEMLRKYMHETGLCSCRNWTADPCDWTGYCTEDLVFVLAEVAVPVYDESEVGGFGWTVLRNMMNEVAAERAAYEQYVDEEASRQERSYNGPR